jgi:uncharacterized membrane protein
MNEPIPPIPAPSGSGLSDRNLAFLSYGLHLLGAFNGLSSIVALVINYIKRDEVSPELASHHRWMIRTFWWGLFWCVISLVLALVLVGFLVYFVVVVWWIYRHVRGLLALSENKPLPV